MILRACIVVSALSSLAGAQTKVVVAAPNSSQDAGMIVIPPYTSWNGVVDFGKKGTVIASGTVGLTTWLASVQPLDGLSSPDLKPWHLLITYEQFDEDGDKIHSGSMDEIWAGPKKFRRTYASDNFSQTDFATDHGLFRQGDQRWPNRAELQVRTAIVEPFNYASTFSDVQLTNFTAAFGPHNLDCVALDKRSGGISSATQYCFDPGTEVLRYVRGPGWYQTTYNRLMPFQSRDIGTDVAVTDGGKKYLVLHVHSLESVANPEDSTFIPPAYAIDLSGKKLTGVAAQVLKTSFPEWPDSIRHDHFKVTVAIVIGKTGHVESAHAIDGPAKAYKAAEDTAKKWVFKPYEVLGEPVEIDTKIELSNN
jgi:hypothetical protein